MSLFDRGYMRNPYAGAERRDDSGRSMLFTLILINLGVFLSTLFAGHASIEEKGVKLRKRPFFPRPSRPFPTLKNTDGEYCPHPFTAFIEDDH